MTEHVHGTERACTAHKPAPAYCGEGIVTETVHDRGICRVSVSLRPAQGALPVPGQFYMLRARPSGVLLGRPISLFFRETRADGTLVLSFLILPKGTGTQELCTASAVTLFGPLGNSFPDPRGLFPDKQQPRLLLIGGGIGIAPPAGFAALLAPQTYDFYACFKTHAYGTEHLRAQKLVIAAEDGSSGVKGMLSDVLCTDDVRGYDAVYACGPEPMLEYVQRICRESGVPCWLSVESRMACGTGACLGCTIRTAEGIRRVCTDGPVFPAHTLVFPLQQAAARGYELHEPAENPDLSVTIAGVRFANPVIAASGTFGYGTEYGAFIDAARLGGICSKGLTLHPRTGSTGIRLHETPAGLINSIGLENPGIPHFIAHELPPMLETGTVVIANLSGSSLEEYAEGARLLDDTAVSMIELNISCPNVKAGGMAFGLAPEAAAQAVRAVRRATAKPLIVKLSPNAPDLCAVARAALGEGADALSLVNTFQAMAIDIESGRPVFDNIRAGLSGPAVMPIALRMVYDVVQMMNTLAPKDRIPVIGLGGIGTWQDAIAFIMAGAHAVQVGAATFANPRCMTDIIEGIASFMKRRGIETLDRIRGCAQRAE